MPGRLTLEQTRRGIFVKLPSVQVIDLAASAGFDFVVVDLEHSLLDFRDVAAMVLHSHTVGLPAIVRLPAVDHGLVNRLLEAGAAGIQLSTTTHSDQVRGLREAMFYAPDGTRSIGTAHRSADYGRTPTRAYVAETVASPPLLVAQIETLSTDSPLADIAVAGADVLFIGQADLAVAASFDSSRVQGRVQEIIEAAKDANVAVGGIGLPGGVATYDVVGADLGLLADAFTRAIGV